MKAYALAREARQDLAGIWRYSTKQWSIEQADRYVATIHTIIQSITDSPNKGRRCDDIRAGYRKYRVGSHVVFYRPTASGIEVLRILHQSMDFQRHVKGEK